MISLSCHFLKHGNDLAVKYELNSLADLNSVISGIQSLCISHVHFKILECAFVDVLFKETVFSHKEHQLAMTCPFSLHLCSFNTEYHPV